AAVILLPIIGPTPENAVAALVLSFVAALAVAVVISHSVFPLWKSGLGKVATAARHMIRYSLPTAIAAMCSNYIAWVDRLVLVYSTRFPWTPLWGRRG